ncbi:MAG TPA: Crp/Fnr family transcriptional regulator [Terriglobales bacterium]|nr:Crp/Fnr family transcriptional regulator [Terriglobales bacterium]
MSQSQRDLPAPIFIDRKRILELNGHPVHNIILASIAEQERRLLQPILRFVSLDRRESLYNPGEKIENGYFPNTGLVSLLVTTAEGNTVEVGTVGREGFVGLPILFGFDRSPHRALIQVPPGEGFLIKADDLKRIKPEIPETENRLYRFSFLQGLIMAQNVACNRLHEVDQRLARWLLMSQDRLQIAFIDLTQDFLAQMLGSSRPTVTLAVGSLEQSGAIQHNRGKVTILDKEILEQSACECYGVIGKLSKEFGL